MKYENKSTLNVDGWEQGMTAEKIKEELNNFEADQFDENCFKLNLVKKGEAKKKKKGFC